MEELLPLLVWGILILLFTSGGRNKKKKDQAAREALLEARRQRMAEDAAAEGLVGVATGEEPEDDRAREVAWGTREPMRDDLHGDSLAATETGPSAETAPPDPQMPRDVWELIQALARGTLPHAPAPVEAVPPVAEPVEPAYEIREERTLPAPAAEAPARDVRAPSARRTIQEIRRARSDGGITAVDTVEHAEGTDPTLTDVDTHRHSKVAAAVARARSRRNAGQVRERPSLFGAGGRSDLRRAVVLTEVLGKPTSLRDGPSPYEPPE